jgi:transposase-like protein
MGKHFSADKKLEVINRYYNGERTIKLEKEYGLSPNYLYRWIRKYEKEGYEGLKDKSGKASYSNPNAGLYLRKPKSKIEELELELMKKDIEIARLKKGYNLKGVGAEKEFVTTFDKNTK